MRISNILGWLTGMIFSFDIRLPDDGELQTLEWPLLMIMSLLIMFVYLLPIIMGSRGIWGLSKKAIFKSIKNIGQFKRLEILNFFFFRVDLKVTFSAYRI